MSVAVEISKLSDSEVTLCETDLVVSEEVGYKRKNDFFQRPTNTVGAYRKEKDHLMVPFHWGVVNFGNRHRPSRAECDALRCPFRGTLRPEQVRIQSESLSIMNKRGSCLIAVYPGGGKCLLRGTPVLLASGTTMSIEYLREGMLVVGDKMQAIRVLDRGRGMAEMYKIRHAQPLLDYVVNRDHILTLWSLDSESLEDVELVEFLSRRRSPARYKTWTMRNETFAFEIVHYGYDEYYGIVVEGNGRFHLGNGVLTHNTITSLSIASSINLRTFILVNKLVLIKQWLDTIHTAFGEKVRVQVLYSKTRIDPSAQFYIMNAINVCKRDYEVYKLLKIGLVIVDECHLMMTRLFSQSLTYFCPRYLIGLSATPFRPDGFDAFLDLYFGKEKVVRKLFRPHQVLVYESGIKIESKSDAKGDLIWNSVIESQTENADRNKMIADLCVRFKRRNILILSKRVLQIETIHDELARRGQHVTMIRDGDGTFDREARIVIATFQKVGTGFSHNKLDMLIMATDAEEYFMQYLGRVFRTPDVVPIVVDIVDRHPVLKRHFASRKKIYIDAGGKIEKFDPKILDITPEEDRIVEAPPVRLLGHSTVA